MNEMQSSLRARRFPSLPLTDQLWLLLFVWLGALIFTFVVTLVVSAGDVSISGWGVASGAAPWFVGFMSGYFMFQHMPMFVANGRTRRECLIDWSIFVPIYAALGTLLVTLGYVLEYVYYGVAGWESVTFDDHLFTSHTDVIPMFGEYLVRLLVWAAAGGFVGASVYRSKDTGWLTLLPAALLTAAAGSFGGNSSGPFGFLTRRFPEFSISSWWWTILVGVVCIAIGMVCTWWVFRDTPLRNK